MINIYKSRIEGFASIKDEEFDWGVQGLNIIQAKNGYGKTKFINALVWCIYGRTLSGSVELWEHLRNQDYHGVMVETNLAVDGIPVTITRCKEYSKKVHGSKGSNRLLLSIDGELYSEKDKKKIQVQIENLLGYSFDLFKNTIVFGQKLKRLISETGPNKKKVFEEAFEVSYIPKAKSLIEKDKQLVELSYFKQKAALESLLEKQQELIKSIEREEFTLANFESIKKSDIDREESSIEENLNEIEELSERLPNKIIKSKKELALLNINLKGQERLLKSPKLNGIEYKLGSLNGERGQLGTVIEKHRLDIALLNKAILTPPLSCENCGKPYTKKEKDDFVKSLEKKKEDIINKLPKVKERISNINRQIKELEILQSSKLNATKLIETYTKEIKLLETHINKYTEIAEDIEKLEKSNESHKALIETFKSRTLNSNLEILKGDLEKVIVDIKKEKIKVRKLKSDLRVKRWLIEEPLSNTGLKAFIFNHMLGDLNGRLHYYSKFIPFQILFDLDMESHHKDINTHVYYGGKIVPYEDLSGGQQQAVDIISAFAIHDVVSSGKDCNLLIMDELFESLDKSNIEIMTELIQDKAKDKCLYLITHNTEFNPTNSNLIKVIYKEGFTSLA